MNKDMVIFCDFDGTISLEDVTDKLLEKFADTSWLEHEALWKNGQIGSKECLRAQINCISKFSMNDLMDLLKNIHLDPHFKEFYHSTSRLNIDFYIISDGFDLIIRNLLSLHGIENVTLFSNKLELKSNKLDASFPFSSELCEKKSGMCKCQILNTIDKARTLIYVGDGQSDFCAIKNADIIFAKNDLAKYCENNKISYLKFNSFKDIERQLFLRKELPSGNEISFTN